MAGNLEVSCKVVSTIYTRLEDKRSPSHVIYPGDHTEVDDDGPPFLTMEECASSESSSRLVLIQESSSTAVRAHKSPSHIIIPGDHTEPEVDNDGPPFLTMEEHASSESSSRPVLIQESYSIPQAVRAHRNPSHIIIPGDHTEVDDNDSPPSLTINQHKRKRKRKNDGPSHGTYQFDNCSVYMDSFNTRGVEIKNSANYAPVTRLSSSLLYFSRNHP